MERSFNRLAFVFGNMKTSQKGISQASVQSFSLTGTWVVCSNHTKMDPVGAGGNSSWFCL